MLTDLLKMDVTIDSKVTGSVKLFMIGAFNIARF